MEDHQITLHVFDDADGRNVWCTDVPSDFTDLDVKHTIQCAAEAGDKAALRALSMVRVWCRMNPQDSDGSRVYLDD